jgi:hypothetical protein
MSATKGTPKNSRNTRVNIYRIPAQLQQDSNYSRNASNSMILITAGKSATAERQATAGTSRVVDSSGKFATGVVETGGKLPVHQIFATGVR